MELCGWPSTFLLHLKCRLVVVCLTTPSPPLVLLRRHSFGVAKQLVEVIDDETA